MELVRNLDYCITFCIVVCILGTTYFMHVCKQNHKKKAKLEVYPPEGMSSLQVAFFYSGSVFFKDFMSLVISLANQGYLKIASYTDTSMLSDSGYAFVKLKEYDGSDNMIRQFFDALFADKSVVTKSDLFGNFQVRLHSLKSIVNTKENKKEVVGVATLRKLGLIAFMVLVIQILMVIKPFWSMFAENGNGISSVIIYTVINVTVVLLGMWKLYHIFLSGKKDYLTYFWAIFFAEAFMLVVSGSFVYLLNPIRFVNFVLGIICIFSLLSVQNYILGRSPRAQSVVDKILGFKRFLEEARREDFRVLIAENPTYFYDILPYAYVIDASDMWQKAFESVDGTSPIWYEGEGTFTVKKFEYIVGVVKENYRLDTKAQKMS